MVKRILEIVLCCMLLPAAVMSHAIAATACVSAPEFPLSGSSVVTVASIDELHRAVGELRDNTTILIKPGQYALKGTLSITADNVTVTGGRNGCESVHLIGPGMDNSDHQGVRFGFWVNAENTTIANMTISDVYYHAIQIDGNSHAPHIHNVRLLDTGQQFIKSNPNASGGGVDKGVVEYSVMEYTQGTPKTNHDNSGIGYTNGVDVHAGEGWRISNNVFKHFHTPDTADHLWNAAVLMWRGARNTVTENNFFYNVDRAIAYGLGDTVNDHRGGVIRNNVIVMSQGLYSRKRRRSADAPIIVWQSPGTHVLHNTVVTNGNTPFAIESRFDDSGITLANNLTDAPVVHSEGTLSRNVCKFSGVCGRYLSRFEAQNVMHGQPGWFEDINSGNARLTSQVDFGGRLLQQKREAPLDFTGAVREKSVTPGAFEISGVAVASE